LKFVAVLLDEETKKNKNGIETHFWLNKKLKVFNYSNINKY